MAETTPNSARDTSPQLDPNLAAGLLFVLLGAGFAAVSLLSLKLGTPFRMGPGFFPAIVGGLLFLLGLLIAFNAWRAKGERPGLGSVPWRPVIIIPTAFVLFGLAMRPLGLVPALLILCFLAAISIRGMSIARAALLAAIMTGLCVGIFSYGLGIKLPLLGDWLR